MLNCTVQVIKLNVNVNFPVLGQAVGKSDILPTYGSRARLLFGQAAKNFYFEKKQYRKTKMESFKMMDFSKV